MARRFTGERLVLATHNPGKLTELGELLRPHGVEILGGTALGLPEPDETGDSFAANAEIKALAAMQASGLPALADDSGLIVHGLDGQPGIESARWAGPERDFDAAMARVHDELVHGFGSFAAADRRAAFVAVLCLAWPDGHLEWAEGRVSGAIVDPPRGQGGFGYDPIFEPEGLSNTFAELPPAEKHRLSHRGRALANLVAACFTPE